jgi:hypothetical protein
MKLFLLFAVAGLIVGSTYRTEISQYVADLAVRPSEYGGGTSVVNSIQSTGNSQNALMSHVGGALDR